MIDFLSVIFRCSLLYFLAPTILEWLAENHCDWCTESFKCLENLREILSSREFLFLTPNILGLAEKSGDPNVS